MSSAFELFDHLVNARDVKQLLNCYQKLNENLFLNENVNNFSYFQKLKKCLQKSKQILKFNKISSILQKLDKRSQLKCYQNNQRLNGQRVLVIGGGISGLRVAIELLLLGATVVCVEKRDTFSRNNVIHLWPNVITDLRLLAAKRFYGRFCVGSIDHIAIRQIQLILLKIALIFGLEFCPNVTFDKLCPQLLDNNEKSCEESLCHCCCHSHSFGGGAVAHFVHSITNEILPQMNSRPFDIIVGADGRRNTLFQDFPRKEFRGKLAIAITANFVNRRTEEEVRVSEISGVSYIYAQKWFKELLFSTGVQLENICYYRDETHYFVMTATKQSLLSRRVLIQDLAETHLLLAEENIDRKQLLSYARDAAQWTSGLKDLEFALNASQSPDVALFDFTSVYAARNASRAKRVRISCCESREKREKHVLMLLTGDSLLEPFWPTGSGAGRGFLSALDAAYCALQWTEKVVKCEDESLLVERMIDVIAERESVYRLLAQTTPENIQSKEFSLQPKARYSNWNSNTLLEVRQQVRHLVGKSDVRESSSESMREKRARRATVAVTQRDLMEKKEKIGFDRFEREEEQFERREQLISDEKRKSLKQKAEWLLGDAMGARVGESRSGGGERERRVKKKEIMERAKELEEILKESSFEPQLSRVGKIEGTDWNVRVWEEGGEKKGEKVEKRRVLENSKVILNSRKKQIEEKMRGEEKRGERVEKRGEKRGERVEGEWIQRMSEELTQRMSAKEKEKEEEKSVPSMSTQMPKCVRCGLDVTAVERISVSGDVLHRSCLRCSKCGISLRLNEFRNELKFLCIYCLKNNSKNQNSLDLMKAKEDFLRKNQKIDFRERVEFENNKEIEVIERKAINQEIKEDSDSEITFDLTSSDSNISSDSSDGWQTDDESTEEEEEEEVEKEVPKEEIIPSIRISSEDSRPRYSGFFTEKLFRSKSQPLLFTRRGLRPFLQQREDKEEEEEDLLPFADIGIEGEEHFSPVRALKAPIIEFKDI